MPNPVTYPGARTFCAVGVEATQGTPVSPAFTMPLESFLAQDVPVWVDDKSLYGDMAGLHGVQQGGLHGEFTFNGPYFGDYSPAFFHNLLGDLSEDGTYTGSNTTTLSATAPPGQTFVSTVATIPNSTVIAIGSTTSHSEIRTITSVSGAGPFTLNFATPLAYNHPSAEVVRPVQAPFSHVESLLNTAQAQPSTLTLVDWVGLTPTTQARAYPGACLSELTLKGMAESQFVTLSGKGSSWPSAAAAVLPVAAATTAQPMAAWRSLIGFAGPASGGTLVKTLSEFTLTLTRQLKPEFTLQASQNPFTIQRGNFLVTGSFVIPVPSDETFLNYMLNNTQPQFQLVVGNAQAGANLLSLQVDLQNAAFKTAPVQKAEAVGYNVTFEVPASVTNAGVSGGRSPLKITTQNAINQSY